METTKTSIETIVDYLYLALRYIASGFVAIGTYVYLSDINFSDFAGNTWLLVFAAATIGILTYGVHFAILDKIFYGWCILTYLKKNNYYLPVVLHDQINEWQIAKFGDQGYKFQTDLNEFKAKTNTLKMDSFQRKILFSLANQTYLRSISKNEKLAELQKQVEKRLALLNFLYCSSYLVFVVSIYHLIASLNLIVEAHWPTIARIVILILFAFGVWISAYLFNRRICGREMWLVQNFSQKVSDISTRTATHS